MRLTMFKRLAKKIIRNRVWAAKKKAIAQILASRCRQDGMPEYGRFTPKEIKHIILQANQNIKELMPYFNDLDSVGNYQNEYGGLIDLAIYRALVKGNITRMHACHIRRAYDKNLGEIDQIEIVGDGM